MAIPMILVAGTFCAETITLCLLLFEEFEYSSKSKLWLLLAIPYLTLAACLTFVFNCYVIILAILASPVGVGFIVYELTDEFRHRRELWRR